MPDPAVRVTPALMTSRQVAERLNVSTPTLSRWRAFNSGPDWINLGGLIRYRPADVERFIEESARGS